MEFCKYYLLVATILAGTVFANPNPAKFILIHQNNNFPLNFILKSKLSQAIGAPLSHRGFSLRLLVFQIVILAPLYAIENYYSASSLADFDAQLLGLMNSIKLFAFRKD